MQDENFIEILDQPINFIIYKRGEDYEMNRFWEDLAKSVRKWEKSRDVILLKLVGLCFKTGLNGFKLYFKSST